MKRWLAILGLIYLGILLLLMAFENQLVYVRGGDWDPMPGFVHDEVQIASAGNVQLTAWYCPCPATIKPAFGADRPVVLYCHGNAGNISHRAAVAESWQRTLGADVMMFDYQGYGKSAGSPTEAGLYADGEAVLKWLTETRKIERKHIVLFGESIGGAVAAKLASETSDCAGLVLERTFTSLPDAAARHFPWLPVRWIMRNRFPTIDRIGNVRCPIFIASADQDEVVPFAHGKILFDRANEPKQYLLLKGLGHNDPPGPDYSRSVREFLASKQRD